MKQNTVNINEIAKQAAKEAVKEFNQERLKDQRKKVLHNTKLLLKHYKGLKDYVENSIDKSSMLDLEIEINSDMDEDEIYIWSIKKSKTRTMIMISHVEAALEALRKKQEKVGQLEKYEALIMFYIEGKSYEEIQEHFNCSKNTPGRWFNMMIDELSINLFGVEGLKLEVV